MMSSSGSDGQPETLAGVTVTLTGDHAMGEQAETNMETGGYAFTGLRAGSYTVTISGYPEDVEFEELSMTVEVGVGEVGTADFEGAFIRTAAIEGRVIIEGEGLPGVTVTLVGGPADESHTKMTGADGEYAFTELRPGTYQVDISGYDPRDYEFAATSQEVSVGLDETETVSFTGELLRTAGIAGRVSVEGMGLGEIAVTLSGAADASTTTDASGQYAFAGLAAGDYTVSIAVESDAYVFDAMSADVTVGDDQSAIVNFDGAHATTASVSGMLFIDELDKNDMMDEGEHPLPAPGVPVALVGPGVSDQRLGATGPDGTFMFAGLRAGSYKLVVLIDPTVAAALAAQDLQYGGPATGYDVDLAVGEARTQAVPFDITHTTVNFTVSLKSGEETGDAVPGAMVTLYSDAAGETRVGGGETGDDGSVAIKVARAGTSGNMVHAGVSADGYSVADGMTAVSWNPQLNMTAGTNDNDIVNLNVDVTVSGATITTDYGGGDALAGWAISVMSGEDAVEGAPEALDDDGNAAFMTTVESVPASYSFALAEDQDDEMDGGENYEADPVVYTHTGLSLAGTMDAGALVANYTTQTLKVYVHHERDQVVGYTGNVLGGDERDDGRVNVGLRYIDDNGRSRAFQSADKIGVDGPTKGAWTFSNVPADKNVIVQAEDGQDEDDDDYMAIIVLDDGAHSDELAAFGDAEANGITGGHFGDMGGYSHTVSLCPLQASNPQDYGECSSFAYVSAHTVSGLIWKQSIEMDDGDDFEVLVDPDFVAGITVSLTPVDGKNLAGEDQSATTAEEDDDDTEDLDETHQFAFADIASGAYMLGIPDGWRAKMGGKDATADVGNALNPLGADGNDVSLDITPATATVYGFIVDEDGFAMNGATVTANGGSAMTDGHGRFIIESIVPETRKVGSTTHKNSIFVEASVEGVGKATQVINPDSAMTLENTVTQVVDADGNDLSLSAAAETASISGTVSASGSAAPVAGAMVEVSYDDGATFVAPENLNAKSSKDATKSDIHVTGADGTYTVTVKAQDVGETVSVRVSKDGMSFIPDEIPNIPAHAGSEVSGFNFTGFVHARITGRVVAAGGGPMSGVVVTATPTGESVVTAADTTGRTGSFSLSVPHDRYEVAATAPATSLTRFTYPDGDTSVRVAPGQSVNFGKITGASVNARSITATRQTDETSGNYNGTIDVTWRFDNVAGFTNIVHSPETCITEECAADADWITATFTPDGSADTEDDETEGIRVGTIDAPTDSDGGFRVRINVDADEANDDPDDTGDREGFSADVSVGAIDPMASGVTAARDTANAENTDSIVVKWEAVTDDDSQFRVVAQLTPAALGGNASVWVILTGATNLDDPIREWTLNVSDDYAGDGLPVIGGATVDLTAADLRGAFSVAVESVQGTPTAADGDNPWMRSGTASVPASTYGGDG